MSDAPVLPPIDGRRLAAYTRDQLLALYERMVLIREFEDGVKFLFLEGTMPGTIHQCQGQEATAVGVCSALREDDMITSTFRGHGHALAKGLSVQELLDELFGAVTGCCKGKGGSMHVGNMAKGMIPGIAIVGGGIPVAAGMALALKMQQTRPRGGLFLRRRRRVRGSVPRRRQHGGDLEPAGHLRLREQPVRGQHAHLAGDARHEHRAADGQLRPADRAGGRQRCAGGLRSSAGGRRRSAGQGQGPVFLELLTYRCTGHSRRDPCHYQPKDERERGPPTIRSCGWRTCCRRQGLVGDDELAAIRARIVDEFNAAVIAGPARRRCPPYDEPDHRRAGVGIARSRP